MGRVPLGPYRQSLAGSLATSLALPMSLSVAWCVGGCVAVAWCGRVGVYAARSGAIPVRPAPILASTADCSAASGCRPTGYPNRRASAMAASHSTRNSQPGGPLLPFGVLRLCPFRYSLNTMSPNSVSINASRSSAAFIKAARFRSSSVAVTRRRGPKLNASRVTRSSGNSGNNLRQNSSA